MNFKISNCELFNNSLNNLPDKKLLINTINAHSYNMAQKDKAFAAALGNSDILLPDGISIVFALLFLKFQRIKKIAGEDLFYYEMKKLNETNGKCFFLGSSQHTLDLIVLKSKKQFPSVKIECFSPPFVSEFSKEDSLKMINKVNLYKPDVLFIGMTAPKQEKWAFEHFDQLNAKHICSIGAVFDFFSGKIKRAPKWMINLGFEWFYRLVKEPKRMWKRYILGNTIFLFNVLKEKFSY